MKKIKTEKRAQEANVMAKKIPSQPLDELKKIAVGINAGTIFTDRHVKNSTDFHLVFMVLMFMDKQAQKEFTASKPGMIYEWYHKAGPRTVNGMPMFTSCNLLNLDDAKKVWDMVSVLKVWDMVSVLSEAGKKTLEAIK